MRNLTDKFSDDELERYLLKNTYVPLSQLSDHFIWSSRREFDLSCDGESISKMNSSSLSDVYSEMLRFLKSLPRFSFSLATVEIVIIMSLPVNQQPMKLHSIDLPWFGSRNAV